MEMTYVHHKLYFEPTCPIPCCLTFRESLI
jgi:hypothetical protein